VIETARKCERQHDDPDVISRSIHPLPANDADKVGKDKNQHKSDPVSLDTVSTTMTAAKEVVNASQAAEAFDSWQ
jgi:hypothetical protein